MVVNSGDRRGHWLSSGVSLLVTICTTLVLTVWLYRTGLRTFWFQEIPLGGDGLGTAHYIKLFNNSPGLHLLEPVSSLSSGWPYSRESQYFPTGLWIEMSVIRMYSGFTKITDPSTLLKTFAILRVIPIAVSTWFFGRALRLGHAATFTVAVCFSTSTFNVIRAFGHFGLGMTWTVPAICAVLIVISRNFMSTCEIQKPNSWRQISLLTIVMFLCGLSGFYYSVFGLILGAALIAIPISRRMISRWIRTDHQLDVVQSQLMRHLAGLIFTNLGLLAGFLIQVVPNVLSQRTSPPLISTAARSWTESIVYSGSLETLFYDFHAFLLQMSAQPGVLNFLQTRSTWEARQVGAVAGAAAYYFLLVLLLRAFGLYPGRGRTNSTNGNNLDVASRLWVLLAVTLPLYFVGPFNFGLSRTVIPFIRAWGRLAPFVSLFLIALIVLSIQRLRRPVLRFTLCCLILAMQLLEVNFYRRTFPDGRSLAAAAAENRLSKEITMTDLATGLKPNCSIVQLPIYPYPEFDSPRDSNGDYGLFELPLVDTQGFRWSYGAIKNTDAARHYAPFVSQQPPFARISLGQQIQYWAALHPCAAVIDRTYLYPEEQRELDSFLATRLRACIRPLKGENFNDSPRFIAIDFINTSCKPRIGALTQQLISMAEENNILWQLTTVDVKRFERYWAMISAESTHQLMYSVRDGRPWLDVRISSVILEGGKPFAWRPVELCISDFETNCYRATTNGAGLFEIPQTLAASDELHSIMSVSISTDSGSPLEWGVILLPAVPSSGN